MMRSPSNASKMAKNFLQAAANIGPQPLSPRCIIGMSNDISKRYSERSNNSFQAPLFDPDSQNRADGNSSPTTTQSLLLQFRKTRMCPFFIKGFCRLGSGCSYARELASIYTSTSLTCFINCLDDKVELKGAPDLYKTKLCNEWQKGNCKDSTCRCVFKIETSFCPSFLPLSFRFAHGRQELRSTNVSHVWLLIHLNCFMQLLYKTRLCHFWATGFCNKGNLLYPLRFKKYETFLLLVFNCYFAGKLCRHAHGYDELRNDSSDLSGMEEISASTPGSLLRQGSFESHQSFRSMMSEPICRTGESTSDRALISSGSQDEFILTVPDQTPSDLCQDSPYSLFQSIVDGENCRKPSLSITHGSYVERCYPNNYIPSKGSNQGNALIPLMERLPLKPTSSEVDNALAMLNEALAALQLEGEAAIEAASFQDLITAAVTNDSRATSFLHTPNLDSKDECSLHPNMLTLKENNQSDFASLWNLHCKGTPGSNRPRYDRTLSMPDLFKEKTTFVARQLEPPGLESSTANLVQDSQFCKEIQQLSRSVQLDEIFGRQLLMNDRYNTSNTAAIPTLHFTPCILNHHKIKVNTKATSDLIDSVLPPILREFLD